jgi:hypothetical protein
MPVYRCHATYPSPTRPTALLYALRIVLALCLPHWMLIAPPLDWIPITGQGPDAYNNRTTMRLNDTLIYVCGSTANISILFALIRRRAIRTLPRVFWTEVASFCLMVAWNFERNSYHGWYLCYWLSIVVYVFLFFAVIHYPCSGVAEWLPILYCAIIVAMAFEATRGFGYFAYTILEWVGILTAFLMAYSLEMCRIIPRGKQYDPRRI